MPLNHKPSQAQTSIEYLLLVAVVAIIVIASFSKGSLIDKVHNSAQDYYSKVTSVIMGSNPKPINGGWCPVICSAGNAPKVIYGACECPAPAFGGAACPGIGAVTPCSPGQSCRGFQVSCST